MSSQTRQVALDWILMDNPADRWILALGVALATFLCLQALKRVLSRKLRQFAASTETEIDDTISGLVQRTSSWTIFALALVTGSRILQLPPRIDVSAGRIAALLLLLQSAIWVSFAFQDLVLRAVRRRERQGELPRSVTALISVAGRLIVWSTALLIAIETIGYDATALVTGLGIGGIAIGLALQGVLKDLFGFLAIVLDRPFAVGDTIAVGDLLGTVERVGIKTTRLRALSGEELVFGNHDLLSSRVRNFHDVRKRRIVLTLGVTYDTSPAYLEQIPDWVEDSVRGVEGAEFQRCFLVQLGESSIDFELVATVETDDYNVFLGTKQSVVLEVLRCFEAEGIDLAFPTRTFVLDPSIATPRPDTTTGPEPKEGGTAVSEKAR